MYVPGRVKQVTKNQEEALKIINERSEIFSVDVKEHSPKFLERCYKIL
jgi:hypothetical protein